MWISVKDELPKDCKSVLVYTEKEVIRIAAIYQTLEKEDYPYWLGDRPIELEYGRVTHWMPLPEPPKEEKRTMDDDANMKESKIMSEYIKTVEIEKELVDYAQEYFEKHWEECRQIALYDDEMKKAMNLLKEVSNIHAAALRENSYETRMLSGKLMQQVRALETEIRLSEVQK